MKIVVCASEVVPFAKTGGLADVAFAPVVVRFYFLRPSEYYNLETSVVKTNFTLSKNALSILPC